MVPLWAQWLFGSGIIGLFISVLSLIVGAVVAWVRINRRLDRMEWTLEQINTQYEEHLGMFLAGKQENRSTVSFQNLRQE
jgi:O-antigen ligase